MHMHMRLPPKPVKVNYFGDRTVLKVITFTDLEEANYLQARGSFEAIIVSDLDEAIDFQALGHSFG